MIRGLAFDLGGVVVRALEPELQARLAPRLDRTPADLGTAMEAHARPLQAGRLTPLEFWSRVLRDLGRSEEPADLLRLEMEAYRRIAIVDLHMLDLVRRCSRHLRVGCITNTSEPHARLNRHRGLFTPFDPCILSCVVGLVKPDPDIYRLFLRRAGLIPQETLLVDDREENLPSAQAIGLRTHLFRNRERLVRALQTLGLAIDDCAPPDARMPRGG